MAPVIVTFKDRNRGFACDVEIPPDVALGKLRPLLADAVTRETGRVFDPERCRFYGDRLGRELGEEETADSAGVLQGDYITVWEG